MILKLTRMGDLQVGFEAIEDFTVVAEVQEEDTEGRRTFLAEHGLEVMTRILPMLLGDPGEVEDWTLHKAADVSLQIILPLISQEAALPKVAEFATKCLENRDRWQNKNAAVMALTSAFQPDQPADFVLPALEMILQLAHDEHDEVRNSVLYALGRCVERCAQIFSPDHLDPIVASTLSGLQDPSSRNASTACYAAYILVEPASELRLGDGKPALSRYFLPLCEALVGVTSRDDVMKDMLLQSAHEALTEIIRLTPPDCLEAVAALGSEMVALLHTLNGNAYTGGLTAAEWAVLRERQCGVIPSIGELARVLPKETLMPSIEPVMEQLWAALEYGRDVDPEVDDVVDGLAELNIRSNKENRPSCYEDVAESVLLALGTIIETLGGDYLRFAPPFNSHLMHAMKLSHGHLAAGAAGVVGDMSRALGTKFEPFCDDFVELALEVLGKPDILQETQSSLLATLGDIGCATGGPFVKHFIPCIAALLRAGTEVAVRTQDLDDLDEVDRILDMRSSVLDGLTGIFQCSDMEDFKEISAGTVPDVVRFLEAVSADDIEDDTKSVAGLLGDLLGLFPDMMRPTAPFAKRVVEKGLRGVNAETIENSRWLQERIKRVESS